MQAINKILSKYLFSKNLIKKIELIMLIRKGLRLGQNVFFHSSAHVDSSMPWLVTIGDECTVTDGVIILAHDASMRRHMGYTRVGTVNIGRRVFIGANSVVLPNVRIGSNVIIGAGSVVTHDIPDNCIAAGNPAKVIGTLDTFLDKHRQLMAKYPDRYTAT